MWNSRSLLLYARVRIRGARRFSFRVFLALYVLPQLILSIDALMSLIPGRAGERARLPLDCLNAGLLGIMAAKPQTYAQIDVQDKNETVNVTLKTVGIGAGARRRSEPMSIPFGVSFLARLFACILGLALTHVLFPDALSLTHALFGGMLLTLFYVFLRPVLLVISLPFNLLLFGLVTPLADALWFLLMGAMINGVSLDYWQGALASLIAGICYAPFAACKRRALSSNL